MLPERRSAATRGRPTGFRKQTQRRKPSCRKQTSEIPTVPGKIREGSRKQLPAQPVDATLGAAGSGSATPIRLTLIALRNSRLAPANGRKSDISPSLGKNLAALGAFCSRPRRTPTLQEVRRLPLPASAQIADQPRSGGRAKFL
jgi:hypothetical protein